mgnify:CR=1
MPPHVKVKRNKTETVWFLQGTNPLPHSSGIIYPVNESEFESGKNLNPDQDNTTMGHGSNTETEN